MECCFLVMWWFVLIGLIEFCRFCYRVFGGSLLFEEWNWLPSLKDVRIVERTEEKKIERGKYD